MTDRQIVVASNRGPVAFVREPDGQVVARRGGGGLVSALSGALQASGGLWIASAMSPEDRERAGRIHLDPTMGAAGHGLRYLSFDPRVYDRYYNGISNRVLWFVHHALWDLPRMPRWDRATDRAWAAYRRVNEAFAEALAEEGPPPKAEPAYLVQDYHLSLVPALLRARRPDARIAHFSHIPFAGPEYFRTLPTAMRGELLSGLLGADVVGFHSERWAENFMRCCRDLPGATVGLRERFVRWRGRRVLVRLYPISVDPAALKEQAASEEVAAAERRIGRWLGGARLILRVDRTDLSKNILRGFLAFEEFLLRNRRWRGRVKHLALLNPSREGVPEYRGYVKECLRTAERINAQLGDERWQPIRVQLRDDHSSALAGFGIYDVLLVNPVRDGMNLVAKEGAVLNTRDGVVVLSENAGAYQELRSHVLAVNPFDVGATAEAIATALNMDPQERGRRAVGAREAVIRNRLEDWVPRQVADLEMATTDR
ncbi:MAG TPA: trehalose-6-phosphate synthase [Actinomycetota bacterium]